MLLGKAENVLEELLVRDAVSWNALISGYVQYQRGKDALKCLRAYFLTLSCLLVS